MPPNNEGRPQADFRRGTSQNAQLGGIEHTDDSAVAPQPQPLEEARKCEGIARRHALAALGLCGALAFQEAALGTHYSRQAIALMQGGVR